MIVIGNWVKRDRHDAKWHLVESVVADDAFTKCGRRMKHHGLEVSLTEPLTRAIGQPQNCKSCA